MDFTGIADWTNTGLTHFRLARDVGKLQVSDDATTMAFLQRDRNRIIQHKFVGDDVVKIGNDILTPQINSFEMSSNGDVIALQIQGGLKLYFSPLQNEILAASTALNNISQTRAGYGAAVNALNFITDNLTNQRLNAENSKSAIYDADYAKEAKNLAASQIMSKGAQSMLAQANVVYPEMVRKLIGE